MSILEWISFGKVSAERDDLLTRYFFDNGVLQSVIASPSSFLVLGRKGAGKTAVFRYLKENASNVIHQGDILVPLSFEDYNWNIHSLLTNADKAESMLYKQSWRFVILVECLKAYGAWFERCGRAIPKRIAAATKLLEKIFDSPIPSISQIVGRKLLSLSALRLPKAGLDLEDGAVDNVSADGGEITFEQVRESKNMQEHLSQNIENIIAHIDRALADANSDWPRVFVCFDRVDEAWDDVSYESSRKVIAGLVSACDSINTQYKGKLRPIVFLREDIFDVLSINDANKLREDCGALLHWNRASLSSLILRRVDFFAKAKGLAAPANIDDLFDKPEMRQRSKPSNYLIRRTMMRPRDLISLLSRTVDTMREKVEDPFSEDPPTFDKLECESIYGAEPGYSEWLKQEILDEWKVQRPVIEHLLHALQNNGSTNFNHETLSRELQKLIGSVHSADLIAYLRFLFDNSIIGFSLAHRRNGASSASTRHRGSLNQTSTGCTRALCAPLILGSLVSEMILLRRDNRAFLEAMDELGSEPRKSLSPLAIPPLTPLNSAAPEGVAGW